MRSGRRIGADWRPRAGSYEEAVLDWYEQVEKAMSGVRRTTRAADRRTPRGQGEGALDRPQQTHVG